MFEYVITYKKDLIYISHLDVLRAFTRAIRRCGLPICYSNGFNPHPKITFAAPLPIGVSGECEMASIVLSQPVSDVRGKLQSVIPEGLGIISAMLGKNHFNDICEAKYRITPEFPISQEQLSGFLMQKEIIVSKKTKRSLSQVDIKPDIQCASCRGNDIIVTLAAGNQKNLKPSLFIESIQSYLEHNFGFCDIKRTAIIFKKG